MIYGQRCRNKRAHRVADDDARAESHRAHCRGNVTSVLGHTIRTIGLVGIPSSAQVQRKNRAPAGEFFGDTDIIDVRSRQSVKRYDGCAASWPISEGKLKAGTSVLIQGTGGVL